MTTPTRHDKMTAAAVWLAGHGAFVGWGAASDGKAVNRKWKSDMTADQAMIPTLLHGARNSVIVPAGRLLIIDVDKAGWFERLQAQGLPPTFTVMSPTIRQMNGDPAHTFRGVHLYLQTPEGFPVTTIPGVFAGGETRRSEHGEQSMVLGPYSMRSDGIYEPLPGCPRVIAEAPIQLLDYLIAHGKAAESAALITIKPTDDGDWVWNGATMGSRHDHLRDKIRKWHGNGLDTDALIAAVNSYIDRHAIPLDRPGGESITQEEVLRMIKGAQAKYAEDAPETVGGPITVQHTPVAPTAPTTPTASQHAEAVTKPPETPEATTFEIDPLAIESRIERPEPLDLTQTMIPVGMAMLLDHLRPLTDAPFSSLTLASVVGLAGLMGPKPTLRWRGTQRLILYGALVGDSNYARKGQTISEVTSTLSQIDPLLDVIKTPYIPSSGPAFIDTLAESKDDGVLMVATEMGRMLANCARENETLSYDMRDAWDGIPVGGRTRKTGKTNAADYHLSILGATTPEDLVAKLTDTDLRNGWANRWLWFWAEKRPGGFDQTRVNRVDPATAAFIRDGIEFARRLGHGSALIKPDHTMVLTPAGAAMLDRISNELDVPAHGTIGVLRQRMPPIAVRIAMVAACLDQQREVDVEHLEFGFFLTDYAVQSIRAVFGTRIDDEVAKTILDILRQAPDGWLNTSTIAKAIRKDGSRTNRAIQRLLDAGLVEREDRQTAGRPAIGYRLRTH